MFCCLAYSLAENHFIAHSVVGLTVEVNSVFLHLRKLMQIMDVGFEHALYRVVCLMNLGSFVLCRFAFSMVLITHALIAYRHRMHAVYYAMLAPTIAIMWVINVVLFWRLFTNDVLRHRRAQQLTNNDHRLKQQQRAATAPVVNNNRAAASTTSSNSRHKTN